MVTRREDRGEKKKKLNAELTLPYVKLQLEAKAFFVSSNLLQKMPENGEAKDLAGSGPRWRPIPAVSKSTGKTGSGSKAFKSEAEWVLPQEEKSGLCYDIINSISTLTVTFFNPSQYKLPLETMTFGAHGQKLW